MKALMNLLSDVRVSPHEFALNLMREHPAVQETFILIFITYLAAMSNRKLYHEEVEHLVQWSKDAINALDSID
ncbi:MAG: hypothetical protein EB127_14715 [Alphaproteobacteria bacterium]|nr:hypothetical protein [Alphaproteobacteria bacterium]